MSEEFINKISIISSQKVQDWLHAHIYDDTRKLVLGKKLFENLENQDLANQISSLQKAKTKLPAWFKEMGIVWALPNNLAQSSSEITANFKASIPSGKSIVDLTGGFGVDSWAFAKQGIQTTYIEKETELIALAKHNFKILNVNIQILESDILKLGLNQIKADWVYADPLRRDDFGNRFYKPEDSTPNPVWVVEEAIAANKSAFIKLSPMASLPHCEAIFPCISDIYAVSHQHELKELLVICRPKYTGKVSYHAVQLINDEPPVLFRHHQPHVQAGISTPSQFLFIPDPSLLKLNLTDILSINLEYNKLHSYSHVLTGSLPKSNVPGRCYKIKEIWPIQSKEIRTSVPEGKATIILRDLDISLEQLYKKTGLKPGGSSVVLATSLNKKQNVLIWLEPLPFY